ncbi:MAG: 6-phosphofructokinase 1 [Tenericutes bacterium ADurb.BinA124]|jgi:6-phosphofructokinase 1|nr:MAG: 6-phosphofructokinase 1 [Tenericutes bacterium ADurb.BinA124]
MSNLLIVTGGAPTTVINNSLVGALRQLKKSNFNGKIFAARFGTTGVLKEDFIDLTNITESQLSLLSNTPATAIGTSRFPLESEDYDKMATILNKHDIKYVLFNGGNGTMDTCGKLYKIVKDSGVCCVGIPKTIDNDIAESDHTPGFASCARYIACSVKETMQDVKSLPIHVCVIETMGRNVGWLTASSAIAGNNGGEMPDMILCPEIAFDQDAFLTKAEDLFRKKGGVTVVASEGLKDKNGKQVVKPIFTVGRATYFGDVSSFLANLVIEKLGIKARSEKPGIFQRCSMQYASAVDIKEAQLVGEEAVKAVLNNLGGIMIGIERVSTKPYVIKTTLVPIEKVMLTEKSLPENFLTKEKDNVTKEYIEWLAPLVGEMPEFISFLD